MNYLKLKEEECFRMNKNFFYKRLIQGKYISHGFTPEFILNELRKPKSDIADDITEFILWGGQETMKKFFEKYAPKSSSEIIKGATLLLTTYDNKQIPVTLTDSQYQSVKLLLGLGVSEDYDNDFKPTGRYTIGIRP
jgi:hypothetical protein